MIIYGVRTAEGLSISKSVYSFFFYFFVCGYQFQPRDKKKLIFNNCSKLDTLYHTLVVKKIKNAHKSWVTYESQSAIFEFKCDRLSATSKSEKVISI